jgi:hypothetical protein
LRGSMPPLCGCEALNAAAVKRDRFVRSQSGFGSAGPVEGRRAGQ